MIENIIKIKFDDIKNLKNEEIQNFLQEAVKNSKEEIYKISTVEECMSLEQEIINMLNEHDKYLDNRVYELDKKVTYDGVEYSRSLICSKILYFINKNQVDWQHTLGLYQVYKLWASMPANIYYRHYDTTLRLLNLVKFQGMSEWTDILAINEFLSSCHHDYTVDTAWYLFLSEIHSALISRSDILKTPKEINENK